MRVRSPSPRLAPAVAAAVSAVVLALPGAAHAQANRPEVVDVRFEGNRAFPSDSLARAIVTRETECRSAVFEPFCWFGADFAIQRAYLPRREFPLDQIRLRVWYQQRGYREAEIDTATAAMPDGGVEVTFRVDEGRPVLVDSLEVLGAEDVDIPDLLRGLPLEVGDPLSLLALDAARDTLIRRLTNQGYARADVLRSFSIDRSEPYAAAVTLDMVPGPLSRYGHVSVDGTESLTESTVLRTLQFRGGDLYRANQLLDAQARLFGLEIIRSASVTPDFTTGPDSVIPVAVRIQEGDVRRVRGGGGWTSAECFDADARWVHRNFLGGGRRLQVRGRVSNILARDFRALLCWKAGTEEFASLNWIASVDFAQPWIFSTRNAFQASLFGERQSLTDVFIRRAVGLSFALTRNIGPRTPLTLSYRPELSQLDAAEILLCTSFLVCAPEDIGVLQGANWLAPVGLTFTRNVTNNVLNPSRGYAMLVDLEHAEGWTGSNFPYTRIQGEYSRFARLGEAAVLAARVRAGWVSAGPFDELLNREGGADIVHPQKRFYAGGANSVRGYAQSRLGPRVLTTDVTRLLDAGEGGAGCTPQEIVDLTCDASPLGDDGFQARPTGGNTVLEGSLEARFPLSATFQGALFTDFGQVWDRDDVRSLSSLRVTPGFGFRYLSPIGPLRVDLAYRPSGGERLQVVTNGIALVTAPDGTRTWTPTESLVALKTLVLYDSSPALSLQRFQLHISIGQAF
ncbi:MAG: hypothetical protein AMXMBFR53_14260 [Gemmatimonadota bacterium]